VRLVGVAFLAVALRGRHAAFSAVDDDDDDDSLLLHLLLALRLMAEVEVETLLLVLRLMQTAFLGTAVAGRSELADSGTIKADALAGRTPPPTAVRTTGAPAMLSAGCCCGCGGASSMTGIQMAAKRNEL
jgi:hypothetical protein